MPITVANYRDYLAQETINGQCINFFVFNGDTVLQARPAIDAAVSILRSMPAQHLAVVYPFFFIPGELPSDGTGGGTPGHPDVLLNRRLDDIGIAADVVNDLFTYYPPANSTRRFHWIPRHVYSDLGRVGYTVAHEATHAVDIELHLHVRRQIRPPEAATLRVPAGPRRNFYAHDTEGVPAEFPPLNSRRTCGARPEIVANCVNAYMALITNAIPTGHATRIKNNFKLSRAFENVPASWWA